jgi:hypothetical protein
MFPGAATFGFSAQNAETTKATVSLKNAHTLTLSYSLLFGLIWPNRRESGSPRHWSIRESVKAARLTQKEQEPKAGQDANRGMSPKAELTSHCEPLQE